MPLPFKERPFLPDNKQMATVRLQSLKRNCTQCTRNNILSLIEIVEKGDAEEVHSEAKEGEKWYIPHRRIYHPQKPDKLRVVFDASY